MVLDELTNLTRDYIERLLRYRGSYDSFNFERYLDTQIQNSLYFKDALKEFKILEKGGKKVV